jgi:predicted alpha/beta superfamily hydrolase
MTSTAWRAWALACLIFSTSAAWAQARVEIVIDLRGEVAAGRFDPARDRVGVRGSGSALAWDRSVVAAADAAVAGLFRATLRFESVPGQPVPYKFKVDRPGDEAGGWESGNNRALMVQAGEQTVQRAFGSETPPPPSQRSGRIDRVPPRPSAHVAPREVQVWLPPGYEADGARRYPVLYLHDGQNMFDAEAAGAEWQVDEAALQLVQRGEIQPLIVVAVSHADRLADYTPEPGMVDGRRVGGGARAYARYLAQELKPFVDARYRTRPAPASTAVGGSSLAGLVTMWLLLEHPDSFGLGLVESPSVWWADSAILGLVRGAKSPPGTVWLAIGLREPRSAIEGARQLRDALARRGWRTSYREDPAGSHDELSWAARVPAMLRFLDRAWSR